jgi:hypothetical protein
VVDALQFRYSWTDEYIEELAFETFDQKVQLVLKKQREKLEAEEKRWRIELYTIHRATSFALFANQEVPPTRKQAKKKKLSSSDWDEIEKDRKQRLEFIERHNRSLLHPWEFEEYMSLGHGFFPKPDKDVLDAVLPKKRLKTMDEVQSMKQRIISNLEKIRDEHGNIPLHDGPVRIDRD